MTYWIARSFLWILGWKVVGQPPSAKKCVILAAPHTSNWDAPIMLAVVRVLGMRIRWTMKHTWFFWPLTIFWNRVGALPIDRRRSHDVVQQMVDAFKENDELMLLITPEGTRARAQYWKSGFYHVARGADVPVVLGICDYGGPRGGIGPTVHLTGDVAEDMDQLRAHFEAQTAKYPHQFGPVRLKMEDEPEIHAPTPNTNSA